MRRAEGLIRIDLDGEAVAGDAVPVVAAMNQKTPGPHWLTQPLRYGHPVRVRQLFYGQRRDRIAVRRLADQRVQRIRVGPLAIQRGDFETPIAEFEMTDRKCGRRP